MALFSHSSNQWKIGDWQQQWLAYCSQGGEVLELQHVFQTDHLCWRAASRPICKYEQKQHDYYCCE